MEIKITSQQMLKGLHILSWIIFIGICIQAGGYLFNIVFLLTGNPFGPNYFWNDADLSGLYTYDAGYFLVIAFMMIIVSVLKALMFYWIVKIVHDKKLDMEQPFNKELGRFIFNLSYAAMGIAIFSGWIWKYSEWFIKKGVFMPSLQSMHVDGAGAWLFIAVILFVIAHIFKRGIEIQSENELTI